MKGGPERGGGAETGETADLLDGLDRCLQQYARSLDPCIGQPADGRDPGLFAEPACECASRHVRLCGEHVEVHRTSQVLHHPVTKRPELVARCLGAQLFDVLSLSSLTLWRSNEDARPRVGSGGAEVAPDEVKAQVDSEPR